MNPITRSFRALLATTLGALTMLVLLAAPGWANPGPVQPSNTPTHGGGSGSGSSGSPSKPSTGTSGSGSDGATGSQGDGQAGGTGNTGSSSGSQDGHSPSPSGGTTPSGPTTQFVPNQPQDAGTSSSGTRTPSRPRPQPASDFGSGAQAPVDQPDPTINLSAGPEPAPTVNASGNPVANATPQDPPGKKGVLAGILAALGIGAGATATKPKPAPSPCVGLNAQRDKLLGQLGARTVELNENLAALRDRITHDENLPDPGYVALQNELNAINSGQHPLYQQVKAIDAELQANGCI
ncbi:MAG: hypothetical protein ACT4OM_11740 [Actinomycetota bacterium]